MAEGITFETLGLSEPLLKAIAEVGYEAPTPIQARTLPVLLEGRDVMGQAQTGTGKTAAFALPILERIDLRSNDVQALILAPTRELAIQVAEAFHSFGKHVGRLSVLPVYGGQSIHLQLKRLERGVHVVVGTPGRVMDHMRRGTLRLDAVRFLVLDEADEMLRMGFIEDVEWILSQVPEGRCTALFSATMPPEIARVAQKHLKQPEVVEVERKTLTVPTIEQRFVALVPPQKLEALTRILETEETDGVLVFARTKVEVAELAEKLQARGHAVEAMHGDMSQPLREAVIRRLKSGQVDVVIATDVAARGLDVDRISHVVNYDIPSDVETYVHRIGRTGRAGRQGVAVLFVAPRERRMLQEIERYTRQRIEPMKVPSQAAVAARRVALFKESVIKEIEKGELDLYMALVEEIASEGNYDVAEIAAAAARLARADQPLEVVVEPPAEAQSPPEGGMVRLFIAAGRRSGVRPADIVGTIANVADVPGRLIGAIDIYDHFTFVEIPAELRDQVLDAMQHATLRGRPVDVRIARPGAEPGEGPRGGRDDRRDGPRDDRRDGFRDDRRDGPRDDRRDGPRDDRRDGPRDDRRDGPRDDRRDDRRGPPRGTRFGPPRREKGGFGPPRRKR